MQCFENLLENAGPQGHLVQFFEADGRHLTNNVGQYLWEGLKRGDGLLVIATPERSRDFEEELRELGADPAQAVRDRRLAFFDAQETLGKFMVDGQPEWHRFEDTIAAAMRSVRPRENQIGLRAYGEMVGVLWQAGRFSAAILLEQFWNRLLAAKGFNLFCGYPIDIFGDKFQIAHVDALLCAHTHVLAGSSNGDLESAIERSMDEILGPKAEELRLLMTFNFRPSWAAMPRGEALILWLRNNLSGSAEQIISRARQYYGTAYASLQQ
jgi:hypothetical protein